MEFKSLVYKRYIEKTFILFKHPKLVQLFLSYFTNRHNINYICEIEKENHLSFPDSLKPKETVASTLMFTGNLISQLWECIIWVAHHMSARLIAYQP